MSDNSAIELTSATRFGWKVFTHDRRSPVQGGPPLWDGCGFPVELTAVRLDTGPSECAAGWNYCADIATAWRVGGMWPAGRPGLVVQVEASRDTIRRGDKCRASRLVLLREATLDEITHAMHKFSAVFGDHAKPMAAEQLAWRRALARPLTDPVVVGASLTEALAARRLSWTLKRFMDEMSAWAERGTWAERAGAKWTMGTAWAEKAERVAGVSVPAWTAGDSDAARDAKVALTYFYAACCGWVPQPAERYTVGIREAYAHGLELALPTGPNELGWSMA